jgi:beta-galactosidase
MLPRVLRFLALALIASASLSRAAEPLEDFGFLRSRLCLNGVWQFQPADGPAATAPENADWGSIRVPGTWASRANFPGILTRGKGPAWKAAEKTEPLVAWYQREINVPQDWADRTILLRLQRVSTDAVVFVDGNRCGEINWPSGDLDLTKWLKPGKASSLRILVTAAPNSGKVLNAMGVGQNTLVDAKLSTRGIIGEVFLVSRAAGARIEDVWVRTSVRKKELTVEADLVGIEKAGQAEFQAAILDGAGTEVKRFDFNAPIAAGDSTVTMSWPWADPKLWDVGQPNLYTLRLSVKGQGLDSGYSQAFGFREFWIEGRNFYLNNTPFRIRPTSSLPEGEYSPNNGNVAALTSAMKNLLDAGFNCVEFWPSDWTVRGTFNFHPLLCELSDRQGLPVMANVLHAAEMFGSWEKMLWYEPAARARWEKQLRDGWKNYRNNPSVIMWSSSGNIGGHTDDQDPRLIGRSINDPAWAQEARVQGWWNFMQGLNDMVAAVRRMDPTRPLMIHQSGPISDVYSLNNYLNLIPLQEREEWLSDWSKDGTMPYCAVEFGVPLSTTMYRGRDGFSASMPTEPLMTEFCTGYLGAKSYGLEEPGYRKSIVSKYIKDQRWDWPDENTIDFAPAFQELVALFNANTWRSWRTIGVTGGMIPWANGHGFQPNHTPRKLDDAPDGQRGTAFATLPESVFEPFSDGGVKVTPAGKALLANNGPTLAWICGPKGAEGDLADFTAKNHSFVSGSKLAKRIALLNDSRFAQPWTARVRIVVDGKEIGVHEASGNLAVGETLFDSFDLALPEVQDKMTGEILLEAKIGEAKHEDRFSFQIYPVAKAISGGVAVFDPEGKTSRMLSGLGLDVKPWDGGAAEVLVVGRSSLSASGKLPGDLQSYVRNGGRLVIMSQDPQWFRDKLGLRVAHTLTRRIFRMDPEHPVVKGIDEADLRDWSGSSTLVESKPDYREPGVSRESNRMPTWGWRWGTRGTVSSAPVEKPHRSGWRPLLECEFDLAYSPLMELDYGKGKVVLCTLDLEDNAGIDPAAGRVAKNLFSWIRNAPITPRQKVVYVGNDEGARRLDEIGAEYERAASVDSKAAFVVLGSDISADAAAPVLENGGKVLVLPRKKAGPAGLGIQVVENKAFGGSLEVPNWDEARGISPSDLRWRADAPALILSGEGTASHGLLARVAKGRGVALFCQADPAVLDLNQKAYFRFTSWRMMRTLTQLFSNLGGTLVADRRIFPGATEDPISLSGKWKAAWTSKSPSASKTHETASEAAQKYLGGSGDEAAMEEVSIPGKWSGAADGLGEVVFLRHFDLPETLAGQDLKLNLGKINARDEVFINGVKVGGVGAEVKNFWVIPRSYTIPAKVLKTGDNLIVVRLRAEHKGWDFASAPAPRDIGPANPKDTGFYSPDYRSDFILGDDPYRYFRW